MSYQGHDKVQSECQLEASAISLGCHQKVHCCYSQLVSGDVGVGTERLNSLGNGSPRAAPTFTPICKIPQILLILKSEHCLAAEGGFANWVYVRTHIWIWDNTRGRCWVKETPRKAILSLFSFEMCHFSLLRQPPDQLQIHKFIGSEELELWAK